MRKLVPLMVLLIISAALGEETSIGVAMPISAISSDSRYYDNTCNTSPEFLSMIKNSIITELGLSSYAFNNLTSSYCYGNGDYESINLNFIFKESENSIIGRNVGVNIYSSSTTDFSVVFNEDEINRIDYTLKQNYVEYLVNGTDSEQYVTLSPRNECSELESFFNTLNGEKYFNQENGYCSGVIKISISQLKNLIHDSVGYINYLGEKIKFNFEGYAQGTYDLANIAAISKCDLSKNDYYYPSELDGCYGIYKDKTRVYFSTSKNTTYVSVYGYLNGKAKIEVSAYETVDTDFIRESLMNYLGSDYDITLDTTEWGGIQGSLVINDLSINIDAFNEFKKQDYQMDTNYYNDNTYLTISEPYISIYVPEERSTSASSSGVVETAKIMPYYWGRSITITKSRVYTSITMNENNEALAEEQIKTFVNEYLATDDWTLKMRVTGDYYYYPILYAEAGMTKSSVSERISMDSIQSVNVSGDASSGAPEQQNTGARDAFTSANQGADFSELEDKSIIDTILDFFKGLLGL